MDTMKYQVECQADNQKFIVRFATYDEAMAFTHAFRRSADYQSAVVKEWLPHRGYFLVDLSAHALSADDLIGLPREEGV